MQAAFERRQHLLAWNPKQAPQQEQDRVLRMSMSWDQLLVGLALQVVLFLRSLSRPSRLEAGPLAGLIS